MVYGDICYIKIYFKSFSQCFTLCAACNWENKVIKLNMDHLYNIGNRNYLVERNVGGNMLYIIP